MTEKSGLAECRPLRKRRKKNEKKEASEPMRQKLIKDYASTKIGGQAVAKKGLPRVVEAPEMK